MKELFTWCLNHWQILLTLCFEVVSLIILILRKKVKVNDVITGYLSILPKYISEAEKTGLKGTQKFTMVFTASVNYLVLVTGMDSKAIIDKYADFINESIENILATPNKK